MSDTRQERADLCDLLDQLGPDQPTRCDGWRTSDLTAHLLLRERRPLAAPGIIFSPLAGYTARVQQRLAAQPFDQLVRALRQPPIWSVARLTAVDRLINSMELFVHHEDVRRAQPTWQPRQLPAQLSADLWSRASGLARLRLRRFHAPVVVEAPGHGQVTTGRGDPPPVRISGDPGELLLFLVGRQDVAQVTLTGPDKPCQRLASARFHL